MDIRFRDRKHFALNLGDEVSVFSLRRCLIDDLELHGRVGLIVGLGNGHGDAVVTVRLNGESFVREFEPHELDVS